MKTLKKLPKTAAFFSFKKKETPYEKREILFI